MWANVGARRDHYLYVFFFFQAEDGIRDLTVTGVQTCALPISRHGAAGHRRKLSGGPMEGKGIFGTRFVGADPSSVAGSNCALASARPLRRGEEIGRASCRERVEISVVAVSLKKKKTKRSSRE